MTRFAPSYDGPSRMGLGGGLGQFFGYGGYQQPAQNPFDPRAFAKELGMSEEEQGFFVRDFKAGKLNDLFGFKAPGQDSPFDSKAPIENRVGELEKAVSQTLMQRPQGPTGMYPGYGMGMMPYAGYGLMQQQFMPFMG